MIDQISKDTKILYLDRMDAAAAADFIVKSLQVP